MRPERVHGDPSAILLIATEIEDARRFTSTEVARVGETLQRMAARDQWSDGNWRDCLERYADIQTQICDALDDLGRLSATVQAIASRYDMTGVRLRQARQAAVPNAYSTESCRWNVSGSVEDVTLLTAALQAASPIAAAESAIRAIQERRTAIRFGVPELGALACFDRSENAITLHEKYRTRPLEVLAPHITHEGVHVAWWQEGSIEQEYECFLAQAAVWRRLRGRAVDAELDQAVAMIDRGAADAKLMIRSAYPHLPLYPGAHRP